MEKPVTTGAIVPTKKPKKTIESKFAPCIKVVLNDGTKHVMIPVDKLSSDAQRAILIAKARKFLEDQIDKFTIATLTPAEVKDVLKAVAEMDGLQREQYVTSLNNKNSTELGQGLSNVIKQAAHGAAEGTADAFISKMKAMDAAKKEAESKSKAINV